MNESLGRKKWYKILKTNILKTFAILFGKLVKVVVFTPAIFFFTLTPRMCFFSEPVSKSVS